MRTDIGLELGGGRGARVSINSNTKKIGVKFVPAHTHSKFLIPM